MVLLCFANTSSESNLNTKNAINLLNVFAVWFWIEIAFYHLIYGLFAAKLIYVHKCKHCCTLATQWVGIVFQGAFIHQRFHEKFNFLNTLVVWTLLNISWKHDK